MYVCYQAIMDKLGAKGNFMKSMHDTEAIDVRELSQIISRVPIDFEMNEWRSVLTDLRSKFPSDYYNTTVGILLMTYLLTLPDWVFDYVSKAIVDKVNLKKVHPTTYSFLFD